MNLLQKSKEIASRLVSSKRSGAVKCFIIMFTLLCLRNVAAQGLIPRQTGLLDFTLYKSWGAVPVIRLRTQEDIQILFRSTVYNANIKRISFDTWLAKTSFSRDNPSAEKFLTRTSGTWRTYKGSPWIAHPLLSVLTAGGYLADYENVDPLTGGIRPWGVLDVWAKSGEGWGLAATGVMKNGSSADHQVSSPYKGRFIPWPEESHFHPVRSMLPSHVTLPADIGRPLILADQNSQRLSDKWTDFFPTMLAEQGEYRPEACKFVAEDQILLSRRKEEKPLKKIRDVMISGVFNVDLGGSVGARWLLVYTNAQHFQKTAGIAEYFGLDAGSSEYNHEPDDTKSEYGRIFYGQEEFIEISGQIVRKDWSAAIWNLSVKRTEGGHIENCQGLTGSVDIILLSPDY